MIKHFSLEDDEMVQLKCAGALCLAPSGRWRLGTWICTNVRILFFQGGNAVFSTALDDLISVERCEREYSFGKKPCLKIGAQPFDKQCPERAGRVEGLGAQPFDKQCPERAGRVEGLGALCTFWLMTPDIEQWRYKLSEGLADMMPEADVAGLAKELDGDAEELVWFLYRRRCATIGELAARIGAENHMDVLQKIRREINPASERLMGQPVFVFKQYKWWFAGDKATSEPFYDVIDEGSFYRVIVESPPDAEGELENNCLHLRNRRGFAYWITLPSNTSHSIHSKSYRNGVLELCIGHL